MDEEEGGRENEKERERRKTRNGIKKQEGAVEDEARPITSELETHKNFPESTCWSWMASPYLVHRGSVGESVE